MKLNYIYNKEFKTRDITPEFDEHTDVCVVGLGTAGAIAAISASKQGVSVIGIEKLSIPGGAGTAGGVYDYFFGNNGGVFEEINEKSFDMMSKGYLSTDRYENKSSLPGYAKGKILNDYAKKYGCSFYFNSSVTGVYTSGNNVCGIQIFKDGRLLNISSKIVIDSTGEALVCRLAGCTLMPGRLSDNRLMLFSKPIGRIYDGYLVSIWQNYDFINIQNAAEYSKKVLESMSRTLAYDDFYSNESRTIYESSHIGLRECYCVQTEETYTIYDYMNGKKQKDCLFYAFAPLDNTNHDIAFENDANQDWMMLCAMPGYGFSVGVTKNMMLPKGISGMMIASKGIGVGHDLSGLVRMKKDMEKCGETAGTAAAVAVKKNKSLNDVTRDEIIGITAETGCFNEENNYGLCDITDMKAVRAGKYKKAYIPSTEKEIHDLLTKYDFGTALWRIRTSKKDDVIPLLKKWINEDNHRLKINCAFALGMLEDASGIEYIRSIIRSQPEMPEKIIHVRYYTDFSKALLLAGRLKDTEVIDDLLKIINTNAKGYADSLITGDYYRTKEHFENNFVSISIASLLKTAAVSSRKEEIYNAVNKWANQKFENPEFKKTAKTVKGIMKGI